MLYYGDGAILEDSNDKKIMEYKQVILIRTDLDMSCGKKCVQVSHASMMVCDDAEIMTNCLIEKWKREGMRKVVLKVPDLKTLLSLKTDIEKLGLVTHVVEDFGLTQLEPNTITALGVEPVEANSKTGQDLNHITGSLKLL